MGNKESSFADCTVGLPHSVTEKNVEGTSQLRRILRYCHVVLGWILLEDLLNYGSSLA